MQRLTVSGSTELIARCISALLVCALSTDCGDDRRVCEILVVGFWRIGVIAACANIIDVKIGFLGQRALNALVAGVIGSHTIRIGARTAASLQCWNALVVQHIEIILTLGGVNYLPVVIFVTKVNVRALLKEIIEQAVIDAESYKADLLASDRARRYCRVLLIKVVGKCRPIIFRSIS